MDREKLRSQLISDEGEVLHAYADSLSYITIGVGRLIDARKGGGISHDEAMYLLDNDINTKSAQLFTTYPWMQKLSDARQNAMVNMAFQLGVDGVSKFVNALTYLKDGDYDSAADHFLQSLWAKQTPERAQRCADLIRSGVFPDAP